jgi:hypothetical protein
MSKTVSKCIPVLPRVGSCAHYLMPHPLLLVQSRRVCRRRNSITRGQASSALTLARHRAAPSPLLAKATLAKFNGAPPVPAVGGATSAALLAGSANCLNSQEAASHPPCRAPSVDREKALSVDRGKLTQLGRSCRAAPRVDRVPQHGPCQVLSRRKHRIDICDLDPQGLAHLESSSPRCRIEMRVLEPIDKKNCQSMLPP